VRADRDHVSLQDLLDKFDRICTHVHISSALNLNCNALVTLRSQEVWKLCEAQIAITVFVISAEDHVGSRVQILLGLGSKKCLADILELREGHTPSAVWVEPLDSCKYRELSAFNELFLKVVDFLFYQYLVNQSLDCLLSSLAKQRGFLIERRVASAWRDRKVKFTINYLAIRDILPFNTTANV